MGRIPAWKSLGLKLKYAQEESDSSSPQNIGDDQTKKDDSAQQSIRTTQAARLGRHAETERSNATKISDEAETTSPRKRQKSVSFTDDTKIEDGDSRTTVDFPVTSPGRTPKRLKTETPISNEQDVEAGNGTSPVHDVKSKKRSPKQSGRLHQTLATEKSKNALDYLNNHRSNRSEWKFNKNRDIWIMKNALSLDSIPASLNRALAGYVQGLPKNAGARLRLIEQSRQALSEAEPMSETECFERQFSEDLDSDLMDGDRPEYDAWVKQLPRPRLLLLSLKGFTNGGSRNVLPGQRHMSGEDHVASVKRRKARTTALVEVSSSSESDSSESSDEASSSDEDLAGTQSPENGSTHPADEHSSTSSSTETLTSNSADTSSDSE